VPPPVTRPEKKLSANELLPQSLFPTREENTEGEELDSPDEMQKKEPLATQRKQEEAARYVLGICHCGSTFCLTVLPGY
jgi:GATA-binding protein